MSLHQHRKRIKNENNERCCRRDCDKTAKYEVFGDIFCSSCLTKADAVHNYYVEKANFGGCEKKYKKGLPK